LRPNGEGGEERRIIMKRVPNAGAARAARDQVMVRKSRAWSRKVCSGFPPARSLGIVLSWDL